LGARVLNVHLTPPVSVASLCLCRQ
jgi:hypothetical protein